MSCQPGTTADPTVAATRLDNLFQVASLAIRCGVTNVVGIALGNGTFHDDLVFWGDIPGAGSYKGHGQNGVYASWMKPFYQTVLTQTANMPKSLGPIMNETTLAIYPANGCSVGIHHGRPRQPVIIVDGTGKLKTGGRYVRYPGTDGGPTGHMYRVYDVHTSFTHALGAPTPKFNGMGVGPIPELLA